MFEIQKQNDYKLQRKERKKEKKKKERKRKKERTLNEL
jgi:hypothetical protein